jgi:hypothetical protein
MPRRGLLDEALHRRQLGRASEKRRQRHLKARRRQGAEAEQTATLTIGGGFAVVVLGIGGLAGMHV